MKKTINILLALVMLLSLVACAQSPSKNNSKSTVNSSQSDTSVSSDTKKASGNKKILVVYFSWSGNTEKMANTISENVDADVLCLEPVVPYPTDYNKCGELAKEERDKNARPKIADLPTSIDEYDTIFVGYPIWWHTAPMIIGTFLENYDLSGKEIYPFTQSGSMDTEHFDNSMDFVRKCAKGATVHEGLFVSASDTDSILSYLAENGFTS